MSQSLASTSIITPLAKRRLLVLPSVLSAMYETVGQREPEHGGLLGGTRATGLITRFHFDVSAVQTGATYSPDTDSLNRLVREDWNPNGVEFMGFVHSHPRGFFQPSGGDEVYARAILDAIPSLPYMLLFIIRPELPGQRYGLYPFVALRHAIKESIDVCA